MEIMFLLLMIGQLNFIFDNSKFSIIPETINNTQYIYLDEFAEIFCEEIDYQTDFNLITTKNYTIKTSAGSFFVVYDNLDSLKVLQMTLPALKKNDRILLPLKSFLNILKTHYLIDYSFSDNSFLIRWNLLKKIEIIPAKESDLPKTFTPTGTQIPTEPVLKYDSTLKPVPNTYIVPHNLKRKSNK